MAGVFSVQAHFDGMTAQGHFILGDGQCFAACDFDLPCHQIETGDGFCHRVLNLQTRVHLHKEEFTAGVQQKLHRTGAHIANGLRGAHCGLAHRAP